LKSNSTSQILHFKLRFGWVGKGRNNIKEKGKKGEKKGKKRKERTRAKLKFRNKKSKSKIKSSWILFFF
jgi:hypothetical protein